VWKICQKRIKSVKNAKNEQLFHAITQKPNILEKWKLAKHSSWCDDDARTFWLLINYVKKEIVGAELNEKYKKN